MPDPIDISPYVSNGERPIFALANLPEEVIAVLFASYSRSSTDLRTNLTQLLAAEGEIAGARTAPTFAVAAEKARLEAEEKARKEAEEAKLAAERAEIEKARAELAAKQRAQEEADRIARQKIEDVRHVTTRSCRRGRC